MSKVHLPHRIVHEELALQWVVSSGSARELAMANSWFVSVYIPHLRMLLECFNCCFGIVNDLLKKRIITVMHIITTV
jgi:hypothetical protein